MHRDRELCTKALNGCRGSRRPRHVDCSLVTLPVDQVSAQDAIACNNDVGVHTKMLLNVRHRLVSPVCVAERTVSL